MPITKTARTLQSSTSNAAGATTTSSSVDIRTSLGGVATLKFTNGATGPSVACSGFIEVSHDNTNWYRYNGRAGGVANSEVVSHSIDIPPGTMYIRSVFTGNTGQAVTVEAFFQELTSV
jgi:hypothetical protein